MTRVCGPADRATVLVGHATGFHGRVYDPMLEVFDGFEVVTVDLRGHGDARWASGGDHSFEPDLSWEHFGDDLGHVARFLESRQRAESASSRPLFGFGHSMGAACLLMVEQSAPGTFAALFCYEPVVHPPDAAALAASVPVADHTRAPRIDRWIERTRKRKAHFDSREAAHSNYVSKPPYQSFDARALHAYIDHGFSLDDTGGLDLKCRPEVEAEIYRMGPRHKTWDRLSQVQCPVLLARGSTVQPGPSAWADRIAAELPRGELLVFRGLGHLGPFESPQIVGERAASFFLGLQAAS